MGGIGRRRHADDRFRVDAPRETSDSWQSGVLFHEMSSSHTSCSEFRRSRVGQRNALENERILTQFKSCRGSAAQRKKGLPMPSRDSRFVFNMEPGRVRMVAVVRDGTSLTQPRNYQHQSIARFPIGLVNNFLNKGRQIWCPLFRTPLVNEIPRIGRPACGSLRFVA